MMRYTTPMQLSSNTRKDIRADYSEDSLQAYQALISLRRGCLRSGMWKQGKGMTVGGGDLRKGTNQMKWGETWRMHVTRNTAVPLARLMDSDLTHENLQHGEWCSLQTGPMWPIWVEYLNPRFHLHSIFRSLFNIESFFSGIKLGFGLGAEQIENLRDVMTNRQISRCWQRTVWRAHMCGCVNHTIQGQQQEWGSIQHGNSRFPNKYECLLKTRQGRKGGGVDFDK